MNENAFQNLGGLLVAFAMIALNASFVAAELALVRVRRTRIDELARSGGFRARVAQQIVGDIDEYLSAVQLGVTTASLGLGWVGEPAFAGLILPVLELLGIDDQRLLHTLALALAFACITSLHIIVGELAPKSLSIRRTEWIAVNVAIPLRLFYLLFFPVLRALRLGADTLLGLFGVHAEQEADDGHSEEELKLLLADSHRRGLLPGSTRRLLENVFAYRRLVCRDVMVPRGDVVYLSLGRPWTETLGVIQESDHTRYPLCDGDLDRVVGVIHVKDLFNALAAGKPIVGLDTFKREAMFVAERRPLELLRRDFQASHQHMAIVIDEYGGTAGLVTLEDILEEIVGEIRDEFDSGEKPKLQDTPAGLVIDGLARLDEVQRRLGFEASSGEEGRTIGGYVASLLGRLPRLGDEIELGQSHVRVIEMKGRRIARLLARASPAAAEQVSE